MNWKAAKTSALLCGLFVAVYSTTSWITSLRSDVGTFYFEWERYIPFLPFMIVPYMSIDLFFVAAPFFCSTDLERRILSRRIVTAIVVAGACFLLFPLRFSFDRPVAPGALGAFFAQFQQMDRPFNQLPSLHIALRTILAVLYVSHSRGALRWMARVWFSLIGFSTVFTYQHHVVDVIGGFALGALCIYLFQEAPLRMPVVPNRRVAGYYIVAAVTTGVVAWLARPIGLLLLWPAGALLLAAAGCLWLGPGIFRKRRGRIHPAARLVLAPLLLAQRLSWLWYARECAPWDVLTDRVWIGRLLTPAQAALAVERGVTAVLDLTGEFTEAAPFLSVNYLHLPVMDLTAPTPAQLDAGAEFIREQSSVGIVYVHCKIGYSRTAGVAGAYLLASGQAETAQQAIDMLRAARPSIIIRAEIRTAIRAYERRTSRVLETV
jgi:membrane-associated phospholipid phosphatase